MKSNTTPNYVKKSAYIDIVNYSIGSNIEISNLDIQIDIKIDDK